MLYMITSPSDGMIHQVTAPDVSKAFELMARHFGYTSFDELCKDLGYQASSFSLAVVEDARTASYSEAADKANIEAQYQRAVVNAFRAGRAGKNS